jgi:hypothetical protein
MARWRHKGRGPGRDCERAGGRAGNGLREILARTGARNGHSCWYLQSVDIDGLRPPRAPSAARSPARRDLEVAMRTARPVSVLLVIWLVIGAIAAGQRHYYTEGSENCAGAGTIIVTILAGPLNYVGANPKVSCHLPHPSQ